jgi:hypothetical protein
MSGFRGRALAVVVQPSAHIMAGQPQVELVSTSRRRRRKPQAFNPGLLLKLHEYKRMRRPVRLRYRHSQPAKRVLFKSVLLSNKSKKRDARLNNSVVFFSPIKNPVLTPLRVYKQALLRAVSLHDLLRWISFKPILAMLSDCPRAKRRLSAKLRPVVV